jgi:membrane protease YdiL (CAAX protease family)
MFQKIKNNYKNNFTHKIIFTIIILQILMSIFVLSLHEFGLSANSNFYATQSNLADVIKIVLILALRVSIEELIFRKVLFRFLLKRTTILNSLLATNLLFGLCHINTGVSGAVNALILGLYFSFIYLDMDSISYPIILHFAYNLTLMSVDGFSVLCKLLNVSPMRISPNFFDHYSYVLFFLAVMILFNWINVATYFYLFKEKMLKKSWNSGLN